MHRESFATAAVVTAAWILVAAAWSAPAHASTSAFSDPVTGVSLALDDGWQAIGDPVLYDDTYGFAVYGAVANGEHERDAIARVALVRDTRADLDSLLAAKAALYPDLDLHKSEVRVGVGKRHRGALLTGLPGTRAYSVVFVRVQGRNNVARTYEIGLWSDEPGLDAQGASFLQRLRFGEPTQTVESLALEPAATAAYRTPPAVQAIVNGIAASRRRDVVTAALEREGDRDGELGEPDEPARVSTQNATCGFTAPSTLYWQLQWDASNTFYSGTYYNLQNVPGFSAMSGNYGSWWGTNYHVGLCYTARANQYYANDWPAQRWANAYAAFSGNVEWAGWGTDGFYTLGNYVVVRRGSYRNVTAHLSGIANWVVWGAWVDGYWDVIGWAGQTGGPWDPHLHARVSWGESLTGNGQPYGGQAVRPRRLRCFDCNNHDVTSDSGARYYNSFWHGRWMRY
jgi:hypothetical protein